MKSIKYIITGVTGFIFSFLTLFPGDMALAQWRGYENCPLGPGMMGGWGMGWFGMIFMVAFWVLIIVGLVVLIRWLFQASRGRSSVEQAVATALDILKERYARGELDREEYQQKKRDLEES